MAQKNTILIVDDSKSNLILLAKILSDEGYTLVSATNGADALKYALENDFDLILLDVMMPKKDGFTVFEELKANKKTSSVPVIFITVLNNDGDALKAFKMGAVDYITKPYSPTELRIKIRTQIDLVNTRKINSEDMRLSEDIRTNIKQKAIENINEKLVVIKSRIQDSKHASFNEEEKSSLFN
ncbi:MAG: response regulator [Bacteroidales bacterium]|nr:response regulator [Bacteroidales bacterium]